MMKDKAAWFALGFTILGSALGLSTAWGSINDRVRVVEGRVDRWEPRIVVIDQKVQTISEETAGLKQFERDVETRLTH